MENSKTRVFGDIAGEAYIFEYDHRMFLNSYFLDNLNFERENKLVAVSLYQSVGDQVSEF